MFFTTKKYNTLSLSQKKFEQLTLTQNGKKNFEKANSHYDMQAYFLLKLKNQKAKYLRI